MLIYDINHDLYGVCSERIHNGIGSHLKGIDWRLFVTLTFPYDSLRRPDDWGSWRRKNYTHSFLLQFVKGLRLWHRRYCYYIREELGENRESHLHVLFEAKGLEGYSGEQLDAFVTHLWCHQFQRIPRVSVIEVSPEDNAHWVNYITEYEIGPQRRPLEYIDYQSVGLQKRLRRLCRRQNSEGVKVLTP